MAVNENMNEFGNTRYSKSQMRRMNIQRNEKLTEVANYNYKSKHNVICNAIKEFANKNNISHDVIQLFNIEELVDRIEENLIQQGY